MCHVIYMISGTLACSPTLCASARLIKDQTWFRGGLHFSHRSTFLNCNRQLTSKSWIATSEKSCPDWGEKGGGKGVIWVMPERAAVFSQDIVPNIYQSNTPSFWQWQYLRCFCTWIFSLFLLLIKIYISDRWPLQWQSSPAPNSFSWFRSKLSKIWAFTFGNLRKS